MKAFFITLACSLTTILNFAQTSEHLTFKGVPIDGTLNQFVTKMTQNGFTNSGTENGKAILNGDFAGYKHCVINVSTLKQKDLVNKIGVLFTKKDTWSTLSENYFELKQLLIEKYGEPSDIIEKFDSYQPKDENLKWIYVLANNCKYISTWQTDKGKIQLSIENNQGSSFVKLTYSDKINSDIIKANAKDDL
ncbi:hypothetical protein [Flavobacterium sp.]|uniref:hypothetical protein n=1 Tax=Flavobacterium sp. TaxID=239 RepID=UPI0035B1199E